MHVHLQAWMEETELFLLRESSDRNHLCLVPSATSDGAPKSDPYIVKVSFYMD